MTRAEILREAYVAGLDAARDARLRPGNAEWAHRQAELHGPAVLHAFSLGRDRLWRLGESA